MYTQDNGNLLADWLAAGDSTDGYRDGPQHQHVPQTPKNVLGGAVWSFEDLPGTSAHQDQYSPACQEEVSRQSSQGQGQFHFQTQFSPARNEDMLRQSSHVQGLHQPNQCSQVRHDDILRPTSQSCGVHHQGRCLPARLEEMSRQSSQIEVGHHQDHFSSSQIEEMLRQSSQSHVLKQEYFTPRQENIRGQNGTPITISSGGSWRQDEFQLSRPLLKRAGSPSMYDVPRKRQQTYGNGHVNEQQARQQAAPPRTSYSPYEQPQPNRVYSDHPVPRQFGDPQRHISPHCEPTLMPPSYHLSPETRFRGRSPPRAPSVQPSSQPKLCSPQRLSTPQAQQHAVTYKQGLEQLRAQLQNLQSDPYKIAEQENYRRTITNTPENSRQHQNEDQSRSFPGLPLPKNFAVPKPPPHLDGALWPNAKESRKHAPKNGQILVHGHYVVPAGKRRVPEDQIDRGASDILFTPPQQRETTPSVSSHRPSIQRGRSKSIAPPILVHDTQQPRRENTSYQPPSVEDVPDDDTQESTPLNELLGRQQRQGHMCRNNFDKDSYRAASVLPQDSIFSHDRPKETATKPPIPQFASSGAFPGSPEVISLVSTPDTSAASPIQPAVRSVPMKERIAPAKKTSAKKPTAIPKSINPPKKPTPKTPKNQKAKADEEEARDPVFVRQKRAADLIITQEIKGANESLDLALFGEVIGQTEEEKQRKEDEMRAESQRKRLVNEAELQAREEAEEVAKMERIKSQKEKEEYERLEKEKEDDRNKVRWDAQRKKREAREERVVDELRKNATEKIQANRKKLNEEAAERERLKQEAQEKAERVQAEAKELAKLKAKQEEAKRQAASLSVAKVPSADDGEKVDGTVDKDRDVVMEEEDSLFLPEDPLEAAQYVPP